VSSVLSSVSSSSCAKREGAGTHVRIAVGGQNQMVYLPTTLALQLGFYREEGIDAELQDFAGGAKALQALVGGSADVVSGFYDHTIQMAAEGRALVAFVAMLRFPGMILVTSPQHPEITKIEDLKGRIAGVTTAGSSSQMMLTSMLTRHGVAADAVSITAIGKINLLLISRISFIFGAFPDYQTGAHNHFPWRRLLFGNTVQGQLHGMLTDIFQGLSDKCDGSIKKVKSVSLIKADNSQFIGYFYIQPDDLPDTLDSQGIGGEKERIHGKFRQQQFLHSRSRLFF